MDLLKRQVARAQRRMNTQFFLAAAAWTLFGGLLLATLAIAARKFWPLYPQISDTAWTVGFLTGGVLFGLLVAGVLTWLRRRNRLDAAIEIDKRFGLKERVSSTLVLPNDQLETDAGQALVQDAARHIERIEVSEQFRVRTGWQSLLPVIPAVIAFGLMMFVPDAKPGQGNQTQGSTMEARKRISNSTKTLQKKIAERRKLAQEKGLADASKLFDKIEKDIDGFKKTTSSDRKRTMIKLNNLADQIRERKEKLGDRQSLQQQLQRLSDLKSGPADKLARAMKQGDFRKALDEIKKLQNRLAKDQLSESEREALQKQLQQMAEKLQQMANAHDQAKRQLKEQIERKLKEGDKAAAGQLQRKLDALNNQNARMQKLQQMAQQMQQCSECVGKGQNGKASSKLGELSSEMENMQSEIDELEMLDEALDGICQAKDSMNCPNCQGQGCSTCQGWGNGSRENRIPGRGLGEGQGYGDRPEEETATNFYESQVRGKLGKGSAVFAGEIGGPNIAGDPQEEVRNSLESARTGSDDPLTAARLPRSQREHSRQYFDAFRDN